MSYFYNFYFPNGKLNPHKFADISLPNWPFDFPDNANKHHHDGLFHTFYYSLDKEEQNFQEHALKVNYNIVLSKPKFYYYYITLNQARIEQLPIWKNNYKNIGKLLLPNDIKHDVDNGQCQIILDHSIEGFPAAHFSEEGWHNVFGDYLQKSIYVCCDFNLRLHNMVPSVYRNSWEKRIAYNLHRFSLLNSKKLNMLDEAILSRKKRKFKTLFKTRVIRSHRLLFCKWLSEHPLVKDINYSFGVVTHHGANDGSLNFDEHSLNFIITDLERRLKIPIYDEFKKWIDTHGEKNLYHEPNRNLHKNLASVLDDSVIDTYLDSYFEIVGETNFWRDTLFHCEKTFKPIFFLQPFVMLSEPYSIDTLRIFGYDMFDDFIDHTYDTIEDHEKRFEILQKEVNRLLDISHDEWANFLHVNYNRLIKNRENLALSFNRYNTLHNTKFKGQSLNFCHDHRL